MVLDADQLTRGPVLLGPASAPVARMPVGNQHLRLDAGEHAEVGLRRVEREQGGQVVHVADVPTHPGVATLTDAAGVLQVGPDRERRRDLDG